MKKQLDEEILAELEHELRRPFALMLMLLKQLPDRKDDREFLSRSIENVDAALKRADEYFDKLRGE